LIELAFVNNAAIATLIVPLAVHQEYPQGEVPLGKLF